MDFTLDVMHGSVVWHGSANISLWYDKCQWYAQNRGVGKGWLKPHPSPPPPHLKLMLLCVQAVYSTAKGQPKFRKAREGKNSFQVISSVTHTKIEAYRCPNIWIWLSLHATNSILEAKPSPPLLKSSLSPCKRYEGINLWIHVAGVKLNEMMSIIIPLFLLCILMLHWKDSSRSMHDLVWMCMIFLEYAKSVPTSHILA